MNWYLILCIESWRKTTIQILAHGARSPIFDFWHFLKFGFLLCFLKHHAGIGVAFLCCFRLLKIAHSRIYPDGNFCWGEILDRGERLKNVARKKHTQVSVVYLANSLPPNLTPLHCKSTRMVTPGQVHSWQSGPR